MLHLTGLKFQLVHGFIYDSSLKGQLSIFHCPFRHPNDLYINRLETVRVECIMLRMRDKVFVYAE